MTPSRKKFIHPNLSDLEESDTLLINERSKKLISEGKTVYRFGLGQSPFPVPEKVVRALKLHATEKDYLPVKGLQALRESVAEFHRRKDSVDVQPECVMIGPGSKELVFLLQLALNMEIVIVSPCWVSYIPQAKILGKTISVIHSSLKDKWQLTPALFRNFLEKRENKKQPALMILNYPGNPDGVSFSESNLEEIAAMARKNNIYILSDEIYGQLHHEGKHVSIARYYPEGTIISSGLSKWCGAGGWRLGSFAFPKNLDWIMDKMAVLASETYTSVSAPIQYAAIYAFKGGNEIEKYLFHARRILSSLGNECAKKLTAAQIKVHAPAGGFYLFIDFSAYAEKLQSRGITTSYLLCRRLLDETGVAILHGSAFGRPEEELTARLAYVDFDGAQALTTSKKTPAHQPLPADFNNTCCGKVITGIDKITAWVKSI